MPLLKTRNVIGLSASLLLILFSTTLFAQTSSVQRPPKVTPRNPKCVFLRHEAQRIGREEQDFVNASKFTGLKNTDDLAIAGGTLPEWGNYIGTTEVFAAREGFLRMAASACDKKINLSNPERLNGISKMREAHVKRLTERWQRLAGDAGKDLQASVIAQLGSAYDAETKSFYNTELRQFDDPDIGKDYPDLLTGLRNSALDQNTKNFYNDNARFLQYEEAGQLSNILKGIDTQHGLDYAYLLRKKLSDRASTAAQLRDQVSRQQEKDLKSTMSTYAIEASAAILAIILLWVWSDRARAKFRGIRTGATRVPFWGGNFEWVFWEPGETVVLLQHKRLVPMMNPHGGYCTISAWKGQEYKGKISYKTQFSTWTSDPILTSDGLAVNLGLSVWWKIADAGKFVSGVAADYHEDNKHYGSPSLAVAQESQISKDASDYWTKEAAEFWIRKLAAGTLREQINQLPAEKLISPHVQSYIQIARGQDGGSGAGIRPVPNFSDQLGNTKTELNKKALDYGITIEKLEVQELILPPVYQKKLEAVRVAFLEPTQQTALTEAQKIALRGLADVIGEDKVGLIEVLKHVDLSRVSMNPFTGVIPIAQPIVDNLQQQTEKALPSSSSRGAAANAALPPASGDGRAK